jgi:hypothetical protein
VKNGGSSPPVGATAAVLGVLAAVGFGAYKLLGSQPCPTGQQKINGVCVANRGVKASPLISQYRTLTEVPDVPNLTQYCSVKEKKG